MGKHVLMISLLFIVESLHADTINNYMNIANNIPQMEMKADPQSQAWARSARHVLTITSESIAETLIQANQTATQLGKPLFCLPYGMQLNPVTMNELIQQTYKETSSQRSDKETMTVSQVALLGVSKRYPCQPGAATANLGINPMPNTNNTNTNQIVQLTK